MEAVTAIVKAIPKKTARICLFIRAAGSNGDLLNLNANLSQEGIKRCVSATDFYTELIRQLQTLQFGNPQFFTSQFLSSIVTASHIFGASAEHIWRDHRLSLLETSWIRKLVAEGKPISKILTASLEGEILWDKYFRGSVKEYLEWIVGHPNEHFRIAVVHEPLCSLAASKFLSAEELGLEGCQAFLFCLSEEEENEIIGVFKLIPTETEQCS